MPRPHVVTPFAALQGLDTGALGGTVREHGTQNEEETRVQPAQGTFDIGRSVCARFVCTELRSCLKPLRPVRTLSVIPRSDASQALLVTTETGSHKADRATSVSRGDSYKNASLENQ